MIRFFWLFLGYFSGSTFGYFWAISRRRLAGWSSNTWQPWSWPRHVEPRGLVTFGRERETEHATRAGLLFLLTRAGRFAWRGR